MTTRVLAAVLTLAALATAPALAAAVQPVALVCLVSGSAALAGEAGSPTRPLQLLDRLPAGATITTGHGARVVVAYLSGERLEIGEDAVAAIGTHGVSASKGAVRTLDPVPVLATVAPIANREGLANRPGAVRLRSGEVRATWMYPREGVAVLASKATLQFRAEPGATDHTVAVEDETGSRVWTGSSKSGQVALPGDILRPATTYFWRYRALGNEAGSRSHEDMFTTVAAADEKAYIELDSRLGDSHDPSLQVLRAGVAHSLGLWREGCTALDAAARDGADVSELERSFNCSSLGHP
jgi:hypothetical protein